MFNKKIVVETLYCCKEPALLYGVFFLPTLFKSQLPSGTEFNNLQFLLLAICMALLQSSLVYYLLKNTSRDFKKEMYGLSPFRLLDLLWGIVGWIALGISIAFALFVLFLLPDSFSEQLRPPFQWRFYRTDLIPLVIITLGTGAFFEEFFFRGYLYRKFHFCTGSPLASAFLTTCFFALGHGYQGLGGLILSFFLGGILMVLRWYTHSIWAATLTHGLYNGSVLLLSLAMEVKF
ncbi:MAG: CPBP family intramembrane glutamic endopeptidase [Spirochaetales bacterium]